MKRWMICLLFLGMMTAKLNAQHRIEIQVKGLSDSTFYLVNGFEKSYLALDTAKADGDGKILFQGKKDLPLGFYVLVQGNQRIFDLLITTQTFSVNTDKADLYGKMEIVGSEEARQFAEFLRTVNEKGAKIQNAPANERPKLIADIDAYKKTFVQKYGKESLAANIVRINTEIVAPPYPAKPTTEDTIKHNEYVLKHYFDNVALEDERMMRTPFLGPVLENYLKTVEGPYSPDTLILISDRLLDRTPPKSDQRKYVFSKIAQKFLSTDYLGKEVVYTHVAEKYMIKNMALWDSATVVRNFEYVYRMKKVLIGNTLKDLPMSDTLGKPVSLYQTKSKYILVMIYDPNCHHCQETTKKLVEDYPKLQAKGVKVFMACGVRGQEKDKKDWKKFIKDFKAQKFIHGYDNASSIDFTNDYNTQTYPNVFLLDANYKILANKKLDTEQYLNLINAEEKKRKK